MQFRERKCECKIDYEILDISIYFYLYLCMFVVIHLHSYQAIVDILPIVKVFILQRLSWYVVSWLVRCSQDGPFVCWEITTIFSQRWRGAHPLMGAAHTHLLRIHSSQTKSSVCTSNLTSIL